MRSAYPEAERGSQVAKALSDPCRQLPDLAQQAGQLVLELAQQADLPVQVGLGGLARLDRLGHGPDGPPLHLRCLLQREGPRLHHLQLPQPAIRREGETEQGTRSEALRNNLAAVDQNRHNGPHGEQAGKRPPHSSKRGQGDGQGKETTGRLGCRLADEPCLHSLPETPPEAVPRRPWFTHMPRQRSWAVWRPRLARLMPRVPRSLASRKKRCRRASVAVALWGPCKRHTPRQQPTRASLFNLPTHGRVGLTAEEAGAPSSE